MTSFLFNASESFFDFLGALGLGQPIPRACVGGLIFSFPVIFHSKFCYTEVDEGIFIPRNWLVTNPSDPDGTLFPWWLIPILGAVLFGLVL